MHGREGRILKHIPKVERGEERGGGGGGRGVGGGRGGGWRVGGEGGW